MGFREAGGACGAIEITKRAVRIEGTEQTILDDISVYIDSY